MTTTKLHKLIKSLLADELENIGVEYLFDYQAIDGNNAQIACSINLSRLGVPKNRNAQATVMFTLVLPVFDFDDTAANTMNERVARILEAKIVPARNDECLIYSTKWAATAPASNDTVKIVFQTQYELFCQF